MDENAPSTGKASLVERNREEYGERYSALRWVTPEAARAAEADRASVLARLEGRVVTGCHGTKLDCRVLSRGCETCGEGTWSCLFVHGKCNCRCFWCPSEQTRAGVPTTNSVPFPSHHDYLDYLAAFGFRGVALSGGEPFLNFDLTLRFASAVKKRFRDGVYLWLYTNGTLADRSKFRRLRDAGVDEVRFDIGATAYDLRHVREAAGVVPRVAVEVPAVPEDAQRMKRAMEEMAAIGVDYLNLHQLRLTPHNFDALVSRPYTFLHGPKVTVLESERAALGLIEHALDAGLRLPVNYCSFPYKDRHQRAAARRISALKVMDGCEDVTPAGYVRGLALAGGPGDVEAQARRFRESGALPERWRADPASGRLRFHPSLWDGIDLAPFRLVVRYSETKILPSVSYLHPFVEIPLNRRRKLSIERIRDSGEIELAGEEAARFRRAFLAGPGGEPHGIAEEKWTTMLSFERIPHGLQEYF